ncbi:SpoIIE family protein phosphatase [Actinospica durhamensis]|uniref:SpoIIE family protein phosphatase n=1 Tax=Actinospica durhamensis TaxID=1508375 RepID=A0A941EW94_9ACTN|nr:SpoIIE family protein phosphatase [Actinospica durhamensis]MBR7837517.1 SpoIIE family protein phosphatase [Actinospica durhamensis]
MARTTPAAGQPGPTGLPEGERLELLRSVVDTSFEPSLLVRAGQAADGPGAELRVLASNIAAADLLAPTPDDRRLRGRSLTELMPWAGPSGLLEALDEVVETGTPLRIHDHEYEDRGEPGDRVRPRSISVGAVRIEPGLLLVTLRPHRGTAGTDPAWEEKVHRLAGTGPWEWNVRSGAVHWYAQALAVLGSSDPPGPLPVDEPPYQVHHEDAAEYEAFLRSLIAESRPGHVEVRVLQPAGAVRHIRFGGDPVVDEAGAVVRVYGSVQDVTVRRRAQTALEIAQVQLAARRTRAESERQLAGLLQQVIMPTGPVPDDVPGVEVVARYRPASAAAGVGGDWYGVARLADGKVLMHIGDVAGHGFPAATAMARLYHALQGLAVTGSGAAGLLRWLNVLTCGLSEFTLASACCAIYDPQLRRLSLSNAGHPSPVYVRDGRAEALAKPASGMLGIDQDMEYEERELEVAPGDVLLLYTDGLIERRRRAPDENTASLLLFASAPVGELEKYVDDIMGNVRSDTDDDACLVAVRFH